MFGTPKPTNCKIKVRYTNDASAQAALKRINPTKSLGKPRRVYKCPNCAGYHLSSKPSK